MTTEMLTCSDEEFGLLDQELGSHWRYGVRQREVLSILNDIFDQFVPQVADVDWLESSSPTRVASISESNVRTFD